MSHFYVLPIEKPSVVTEETSDYVNNPTSHFDMNGLGKRLFRVSTRGVQDLLGYYYNEVYEATSIDDVMGREIVKETLDRAAVDLFIKVDYRHRLQSYHIEMETEYKKNIILRMFDYGLDLAKEQFSYDLEPFTLLFPKPLLIVLEENRNTPSLLGLNLDFQKGSPCPFTVPVLFLWSYTPKELLEKNLYLLLPFKVFSFRKEMNSIYTSKDSSTQKNIRWTQCRKKLLMEIEEISWALKRVFAEEKLTIEEIGSMYAIMNSIVEKLVERYPAIKTVQQEVKKMKDTWYDPSIEERGKRIGIKTSISTLLSLKEDYDVYEDTIEEMLSNEEDLPLLRNWLITTSKVSSVKDFLDTVKEHSSTSM